MKLLQLSYSATSTNHEAALMSQIENLTNDNKTLVSDLNQLKSKNANLQNQVNHLQRYEELVSCCISLLSALIVVLFQYKSKDFYEINKRLYHIVSKIGQGGFSEVYHCISFKDSRSFALKKVLINDIQNFNFIMNEIELLRRLQSTQKVIQLYDL